MTFSSHPLKQTGQEIETKCTGWFGLNQQIWAQRNQHGLNGSHLTDCDGVTLEPWALPLGMRPEGLQRKQPATKALTGFQSMQAGGSHLHTRQSGRGQTQYIKPQPVLAHSRMCIKYHFFLLYGYWTFNLLKSDIYWPNQYVPRTQLGASHYLF